MQVNERQGAGEAEDGARLESRFALSTMLLPRLKSRLDLTGQALLDSREQFADFGFVLTGLAQALAALPQRRNYILVLDHHLQAGQVLSFATSLSNKNP